MPDSRPNRVPGPQDRAEPSIGSGFGDTVRRVVPPEPSVDADVVPIRDRAARTEATERKGDSANSADANQSTDATDAIETGNSHQDLVPQPGAAQAGEARRATRLPAGPTRVTPRLGEILVEKGLMTPDEQQRTIDEQARTPDKRFGEIAVHRRIVTQRQVDSALALQFGYTEPADEDSHLPPEIAVAHTPYSPFAEVLRGLRSQLVMRWFDGSPGRCALTITSVDRGDGKSFICANLGVVFSQLGERTLIIDGDLRNSTQHKKFNLPNKMGLSGILSGRAGVEEILPVPGVSNLAVLPAGPLPPNPQELLGREEFSKLLFGLSESFDVILVDTPSAQQATDAQIVGQRTGGAMIIGRKDKTATNEIIQLTDVMRGAGIQILGATLNDH
ncbi:MAG: polysaccharide biosynthesis tyrosine autokinase [Burkholderiaceae bacterium]